MISRRCFLTGVATASAPIGVAAAAQEYKAQQAGKVYSLGLLIPGVRVDPSSPVTANVLPLVLRELGYVDSQNLVIERRFAEGTLDRLPGLARELVQLRVDVLVAASPLPVRAAHSGPISTSSTSARANMSLTRCLANSIRSSFLSVITRCPSARTPRDGRCPGAARVRGVELGRYRRAARPRDPWPRRTPGPVPGLALSNA